MPAEIEDRDCRAEILYVCKCASECASTGFFDVDALKGFLSMKRRMGENN